MIKNISDADIINFVSRVDYHLIRVFIERSTFRKQQSPESNRIDIYSKSNRTLVKTRIFQRQIIK